MKKKIKLAQIGCGYWGPNLLRNFNSIPNCEITNVVELSEDRRKFIKSKYPEITINDDLEVILDDDSIDGVIIATPARTHFELVKKFLLNNKHVFVEKPLSFTAAEAFQLHNIAKNRDLVLMVGHTFLYNPAVICMKNKLKQLGDIYYIHSRRLNLGRIRTDVNVWWNLAPHDISILLYLFDDKMPKTISLSGFSFIQQNIEDIAFATLTWDNNIKAQIHLSWLDPNKVRELTVVGSQKMLVYDDIAQDKIKIFDKGIERDEMHYDNFSSINFSHRSGDIYIPKFEMEEPLKVQSTHFVDCILHNTSCKTDSLHALKVISVLEHGNISLAQGGKTIEIENNLFIEKQYEHTFS